MMKKFVLLCACLGLVTLLTVGPAHALSFPITFSEFPVGTLVDNQYASLGITFSPGTNGNLPIIAHDLAMPTEPVLSPNPVFAGDFTINFATAPIAVMFLSGYWDESGTGVVQALDAAYNILATKTNLGTGVEPFAFVGIKNIAHIYFNSTADPAGADIDNLCVQYAPAPLPGSLLLLGSGFLALLGIRCRKS